MVGSGGGRRGRGRGTGSREGRERRRSSCMSTNIGAEDGAIPAKLSDRVRAMVTAGLAKLVDEVNQ